MDSRQYALTKLFAENFHLNVSDRKELHNSTIFSSELIRVIADIVEQNGKYPPTWSHDTPYDGGLIEKIANDSYQLTWQSEVGVCRFETLYKKSFNNVLSAAKELAKCFFGTTYDGIKIDWSV